MMAGRRWSDLSPRSRKLVVLGAVLDGVLELAALIDIARRPADRIRGRKWAWATVVTLANSVGVVPLAYFRFGRK
jgi:hypothetical protein